MANLRNEEVNVSWRANRMRVT